MDSEIEGGIFLSRGHDPFIANYSNDEVHDGESVQVFENPIETWGASDNDNKDEFSSFSVRNIGLPKKGGVRISSVKTVPIGETFFNEIGRAHV